MKKKLFILILVVGLLPSTVFATNFLNISYGLEGGVYGDVSYGDFDIGIGLDLDTSHGTSSGSRRTIETGTFTALSDGMITLHGEGIKWYGTMTDDPPPYPDPDQFLFLYPNGIFSELEYNFSATLTSPGQTSSESGGIHLINFFPSVPFDDVGFNSTTLILPFRAGEEGSWVVDMSISGTVYAPVPEPTTILLLASGLVGLVGLRKKFKR